MAGRILPVALATVSGIAIGMSTFGPELKERQMKRLTEEYNQEVAAAAALNGGGPAAIPPAAQPVTPPTSTSTPIKEETKSSTTSWSDALGFWAWKKSPPKDNVPAALAAPAVAQDALVKDATEEQWKKP